MVSEKTSSLDERHDEVDTLLVLENVVKVYQERVIGSFQDISLHCQVLHLIVLDDELFSDAFHGIQLSILEELCQEHFTKSTPADQSQDFKLIEGDGCLLCFVDLLLLVHHHRLPP